MPNYHQVHIHEHISQALNYFGETDGDRPQHGRALPRLLLKKTILSISHSTQNPIATIATIMDKTTTTASPLLKRHGWGNSASTNDELVQNLINSGFITHDVVANAMRNNDRKNYVPPPRSTTKKSSNYNYGAYADAPQPLGFRATVSAPYVQALALNELAAHITRPNSVVLDVGSGSGIMVGYMARLSEISQGGKVVGLEVVAPLVELSCMNLQKSGLVPNESSESILAKECCNEEVEKSIEMKRMKGMKQMKESKETEKVQSSSVVTIVVRHGNGWNGLSEHGPFDAIHVGAQAENIPIELLKQLKPGGRMIVPIGPMQQAQQLMRVDKDLEGNVTKTSCGKVRFVPLVKENEENDKWTRRDNASGSSSSSSVRTSDAAASNRIDWDARYKKGWAYGKTPNTFLVQCMEEHITLSTPRGPLRVLCIADGQGRNGVYMASLGHVVTSIDASAVGMKKTEMLAQRTLHSAEQHVVTIVCDVDIWDGEREEIDGGGGGSGIEGGSGSESGSGSGSGSGGTDGSSGKQAERSGVGSIVKYDIIVDVFSSLSNETRKERMSKWMSMLNDDGWYLNECFAPRHHSVRDGRACGPKEKDLVSHEMLVEDTKDWLDVVLSQEVDTRINEGKFHRGPCVLTQFLGRRRRQRTQELGRNDGSSSSRSSEQRKEERTGAKAKGEQAGEHVQRSSESYTFSDTMDQLFTTYGNEKHVERLVRRYADGTINVSHPVDSLLYCSEASLHVACSVSAKQGQCRQCWLERDECLCSQLGEIAEEEEEEEREKEKLVPKFTVVCHPNEFLRSTSSAKIVVQNSTNASKMLVYGAQFHRRAIAAAVMSKTESSSSSSSSSSSKDMNRDMTYVLFPEGPQERTCTVLEMMQEVSEQRVGSAAASADTMGSPGSTTTTNATTTATTPTPTTLPCHVNILVPDGSWECCRSVVADFERMNSKLKYVRLNQKVVEHHHSPLIEALKKGQGLGRISTLEACALLLREMGLVARSDRLLQSLSPLVKYAKKKNEKKFDLSFKKPRDYAGWSEHVRRAGAEQASASNELPLGLRSCCICSETLATPIRMREHVRGKKHCDMVLKKYLSQCDREENNLLVGVAPNMEAARRVYQEGSVDVLISSIPEPPDVALVHVIQSLECARAVEEEQKLKKLACEEKKNAAREKKNTKKLKSRRQKETTGGKGNESRGAMSTRSKASTSSSSASSTTNAAVTKGEFLYQTMSQPRNVLPLPLALRHQATLQYDTTKINVRAEIVSFLERCGSNFGSFPTEPRLLEEFQPHLDVFRNFDARQLVYNAVRSDARLLQVYEELIKTIVLPHLKRLIVESEKKEKKEHTFYYQYPPTLRIQPGPSKAYGRTHRDAEYGHQRGEVNFWMPISLYSLTRTTLEIEDEPNSKKFYPLLVEYGEVGLFHGTLCHHRAPPNKSMCTRVSFDFRVGISGYFDPDWELQGVKAQHERRSCTL